MSTAGKVSNSVISMLHHFLENFGIGEEEAHFHADNCTGQNKNNFMLQYLAWRTAKKLHNKVSMSFMPPGHTKVAPDLYFGLSKRAYKRSSVSSLDELVAVITESCGSCVIPFLVGKEDGTKSSRVPGILENYHFETSLPVGSVGYKKTLDDEFRSVPVLIDIEAATASFPEPIRMTGIPNARKKYLYEKIRI